MRKTPSLFLFLGSMEDNLEDMEVILIFGLQKLSYEMVRVVEAYLTGKDVFFCYPTGSGKLLCFEIAPFVFEGIAEGWKTQKSKWIYPPCVINEGPSCWLEKLQHSSSHYQPRKYCRRNERHSTWLVQPLVNYNLKQRTKHIVSFVYMFKAKKKPHAQTCLKKQNRTKGASDGKK